MLVSEKVIIPVYAITVTTKVMTTFTVVVVAVWNGARVKLGLTPG
jgi:hypothetical protein